MDASDTTSEQEERSDGRIEVELTTHIGAKVDSRTDARLHVLTFERDEFRDRTTKSDLIREALREYLDRHDDEIPEESVQRVLENIDYGDDVVGEIDEEAVDEEAVDEEAVDDRPDDGADDVDDSPSAEVRGKIEEIRDAREG